MRGIPVHVIVIAPTVAQDPVPARTYYIDKDTDLPVRIVFGRTITDVLRAERSGAPGAAEMSPHPSATVHDLR